MIDPKIRKKIIQNLKKIERTFGVQILYACESGSRAWGFASKDSDFDVRFVYVRPVNEYLSIKDSRDVIENPISESLDITGWDIKKALRLFKSSNPSLLEWLDSPVVYRNEYRFAARMKKLVPYVYSPKSCFYHYLHMALRNRKAYFQGERVSAKKYFYVLRPIFACKWIRKTKKPVPMLFDELLGKVIKDKRLLMEIDNLLAKKKAGYEFDKEPKNPILDEFILKEMAKLEAVQMPDRLNNRSIKRLDDFFRKILSEAWD